MPSNYYWENMGNTKKYQDTCFLIVLVFLGIILFFAYKFQMEMQKSIQYYDNYEKFDCNLFHNSLPEEKES